MRAQLVPIDGGTPIDIVKDLTVVGRKEDCDLRLEHKSVSKIHCVLVKTDGLLLLRDLGSTNGTRVNGVRVRRAALMPNDMLHVAHFQFRIVLKPDAPPPAVSPDEHTQQLDAEDVADLLRRVNVSSPQVAPDAEKHRSGGIRPNPLPDVYPESDPGEG